MLTFVMLWSGSLTQFSTGRRKKLICRLMLLLTMPLIVEAQSGITTVSEAAGNFHANHLLIKPKAGVHLNRLAHLHSAQHMKVLRKYSRFGDLQLVLVPVGQQIGHLVSAYQQSGLVEFAEPDYVRHLDLSPNDPKFLDGTLWGLNNYGQSAGTPGADIHALAAWDALTSATDIVVAVLDSGIRYTHEDLAANMWVNPVDNTHGTNAVAGSTDPNDDQGHGTIMAGVLGAVGNNSKGCVGVAWQVQIMACKCFDSSGNANDSAILDCIDYAVEHGARIINASFDSAAYSQSLSNAIFIAGQSGVIFVTSCGNNATNVDLSPRYPACYDIDNIISLAYTTRNDVLGKYSNYGARKVHLAAPGAAIYSTFFASDSSYLGSSFLEGTSYAAAYASGSLALLCARYPRDNYHQIIQRLLSATDPLPALLGKCSTGGRLDLQKALSPPIQIAAERLVGGIIQLNVFTDANRTCAIEVCSDLVRWLPITTNTTSSLGFFSYLDLSATNFSNRFYRATSTP